MRFKDIVALVLIWGHISSTECLECYSCNVSSIADCVNIASCPADSACFADHTELKNQKLFHLGCKPYSQCHLTNTSGQSHGSSIIGRAIRNGQCSECCGDNNCNRQLCQIPDPGCYDSADYDCASIGRTLNICLDKTHAKHNCKSFCGLCSLVDGGWTSWTTWSSCDVTCNNGTRTRMRTCTNPTPKDGGETCKGLESDHKLCSLSPCPVHGGWSQWSSWGSCSSSCDIGMQRRDRNCSNPFPLLNGDHCFGDATDYRICLPGPCADGNWGQWENWGSCSRSCGDGLKSRARHCDNPVPSVMGKTCVGNSEQTESCQDMRCAAKMSAFTATYSSATGDQAIFSNVVFNQSSDYNPSTGKFVCRISGLYYFALSLTKQRSSDWVRCYIYHNGHEMVFAVSDPASNADGGFYETSAFVTLHLDTGDTVYPDGCISYDTMSSWSMFSGFLIQPDYET